MKKFIRKIILIGAAFLPGLAFCGQDAPKKAANMSTELEMQHVIDLGVLLDTTIPLQLSIPVKNTSQRKITISKVSKDCSCTSVSIDKTVLLPGESASIAVVTNLTGKTNYYQGEVIIESDATEKIDEIQVKGRITGQIRIRPLRSAVIMGDKYAPGSFTVFCDDQTGKWKYLGFTSEDPNVHAELVLKSTSPTTSTYDGGVSIPQETARKGYPDYSVTTITLKFGNDHLGKTLELRLPVDLFIRKNVTTDPAQVTFDHATKGQKRTILVQSGDPLNVDSVTCGSSCVKSNLRWIDKKTLIVELAFDPESHQATTSQDMACDLRASGKSIASIPIHVVTIP